MYKYMYIYIYIYIYGDIWGYMEIYVIITISYISITSKNENIVGYIYIYNIFITDITTNNQQQ